MVVMVRISLSAYNQHHVVDRGDQGALVLSVVNRLDFVLSPCSVLQSMHTLNIYMYLCVFLFLGVLVILREFWYVAIVAHGLRILDSPAVFN